MIVSAENSFDSFWKKSFCYLNCLFFYFEVDNFIPASLNFGIHFCLISGLSVKYTVASSS